MDDKKFTCSKTKCFSISLKKVTANILDLPQSFATMTLKKSISPHLQIVQILRDLQGLILLVRNDLFHIGIEKKTIEGTSFFWQTQIQTIEYGLNDTIRTKMKLHWYFFHLHTPLWISKWFWQKKLSTTTKKEKRIKSKLKKKKFF